MAVDEITIKFICPYCEYEFLMAVLREDFDNECAEVLCPNCDATLRSDVDGGPAE